jgi:hypothetical protein
MTMPHSDDLLEWQVSEKPLIHASPVRVPRGDSEHAPLPDLRKIMQEK